MNESEAKNVLLHYLEKDDEEGWIDLIGERQYKSVHPISGKVFSLDENSFFFIVYSIPSKLNFVSVNQLSDEQKNEYGFLRGVTKEGMVFMPEV